MKESVSEIEALFSGLINKSEILTAISQLTIEQDVEAYLVGGFVRDYLLDRPSKDIDILVIGAGIPFATMLRNKVGKGDLSVFKNFGTAQLKIGDFELEFVGARKESYRKTSRKPTVEEGSLADDIARRDFTVNALAFPLNPQKSTALIDFYDGLKDLKNQCLRTPLEASETFSDDPLRMMRAIRFATQLHFQIEKETFAAIKANAQRIKIISKERITEELNKILASPKPSIGFKLLEESGLLAYFLPELQALKGVETVKGIGHKDNFYHTLEVLDNVAEESKNLWLRWAALMHDIAKPPTKRFDENHGWTFHGHEVVGVKMTEQIFRRLKLPLNEKLKFVQKMVRLHLRPIPLTMEVSDAALRRLVVDAGEDLDSLFVLCKADITSKNEVRKETYRKRFDEVRKKMQEVEEKDNLRNFKPPIDGQDVMDTFQLKPGKAIGIIKAAVREAILNGDIPNEREAALRYMQEKGSRILENT